METIRQKNQGQKNYETNKDLAVQRRHLCFPKMAVVESQNFHPKISQILTVWQNCAASQYAKICAFCGLGNSPPT
jgi:hypothetical protein